MEMTLHRALGELRLIDKKMAKLNVNIEPIGWKQIKKLVNNRHEENDFIKKACADFQKANDLFDRRTAIKSAIAKANTETIVDINGEKMSIADAIHRKHMTEQRNAFLKTLKKRYAEVSSWLENHNKAVAQQALQIAEAALAKDNVKLTDKDVINVTKPYIEANELKLVDPLNLRKTIEELEEKNDRFDSEVDSVLSEANAITFIEV